MTVRDELQTPRPRLRLSDGARLPSWARCAREAIGVGPPGLRGATRRVAARLLTGRLPGLLATYPDGRSFRVPHADLHYSQIFFEDEYDPDASRVVRGLLGPGDFAVDVGAHFGWYSILMGTLVGPEGSAWAIEPTPPTLRRLQENLDLNPGLAVDVLPVALGATEGSERVHVFEGLPHGHASMSTLGRRDYTGYSTQRRTLDGLVAARGERSPMLVKLDVEGAEREAIRGADALIRSDEPPAWMMEANRETAASFGYRPADLIGELEARADYCTFRVIPGGLTPERDPTAAHGVTWVCVPPLRLPRIETLTTP